MRLQSDFARVGSTNHSDEAGSMGRLPRRVDLWKRVS
jgi:hypothetical protein